MNIKLLLLVALFSFHAHQAQLINPIEEFDYDSLTSPYGQPETERPRPSQEFQPSGGAPQDGPTPKPSGSKDVSPDQGRDAFDEASRLLVEPITCGDLSANMLAFSEDMGNITKAWSSRSTELTQEQANLWKGAVPKLDKLQEQLESNHEQVQKLYKLIADLLNTGMVDKLVSLNRALNGLEIPAPGNQTLGDTEVGRLVSLLQVIHQSGMSGQTSMETWLSRLHTTNLENRTAGPLIATLTSMVALFGLLLLSACCVMLYCRVQSHHDKRKKAKNGSQFYTENPGNAGERPAGANQVQDGSDAASTVPAGEVAESNV